METADGTAGDADKHHGEDGIGGSIGIAIFIEMTIAQTIPNLDKLHIVDKESHNDEDSHQQKQQSEYGIDFADEFVDRHQRSNEIVGKNDDRPDPDLPAWCELVDKELCGGLHKNSTHQNHQKDGEIAHHLLGAVTQESAVNFGKRAAIVAHRHETRYEVVDGTGEDGAEDNPEKRRRTELGAHDGSTDGTHAGDVEELDKEYAPRLHGHIVDTVLMGGGRSDTTRIDGDTFADKFGINDIA